MEWNDIMFTDESRFCLQHQPKSSLETPCCEQLLNSCVMHIATLVLHPVLCFGIGIRFHCRTTLVRIADTLNSQRYMSEMLEPEVLPYIQRLPSAIFQQDNARPHVLRNV
ncbi:transposable element Tcb1 transposase [Trichonephila clavipes]|nr:transposable element Tcb1 transposase [Trichonephila clavipes]